MKTPAGHSQPAHSKEVEMKKHRRLLLRILALFALRIKLRIEITIERR
jgi:hypothetical protein